MVYLKKNHRKEETKSKLTPKSRAALKEWLWADYKLYDHFKVKLQKKISEFGELEMAISTGKLRWMNKQLVKSCVLLETGKEHLNGDYQDNSPVVLGYQVHEDKEVCSLAAITERAFVDKIKAVQTNKVKNFKRFHFEDEDIL